MRRQLRSAAGPTLVVVAAVLGAAVAPVLLAAPAQATAYRYWSYWHVRSDAWSFSQLGATGYRPADGEVEGWRFAVSPGTASAPAPRLAPATAFASVCGTTAAQDGKKRVAVVVDFGLTADGPSGQSPPLPALHGSCVLLAKSANGWDAVTAAGYAIRSDDGLVCGLAGYPSKGCGDVVAAPPPSGSSPAPSRTTSGGSRPAKGSGTPATPQPSTGVATHGTAGTVSSATSTTRSTATSASTPSVAASEGGVPSAAALSGEPAPSLAAGAPPSPAGGGHGPWPAVLAVLVIAAIGSVAALRARGAR